ncbi:MAG: S9 family peptidase [Burkholderiales bacterium]
MHYALVCVAAVLGGCTAPADHPALKDAALPPLIQAHRFVYRGTALNGYLLSPDGEKLAWIGPFLMRSSLFVRDNRTGEVRRYRTAAGGFQWTPDGRRLLYSSDPSGAENSHVYMIDLAQPQAEPVDLTPYAGIQARIHQIMADSAHVLIYHNRRDKKLRDLYRIDLDTGRETLVAQNPGDAVSPITTYDGRVQGWQRSPDVLRSPEQRQQPLVVRRPVLLKQPGETFSVLATRHDRTLVWALSSRGRDRVALVAAHPTLGWEKVIFEDPKVDVTRVMMSRVTGDPLIAYAQPGYPRYEILDPALRKDLEALLNAQGQDPFGIEIVSTDNAEKRLIVLIYTSAQHRYYLVDRSNRSYTLLAQGVPDDIAESLAPTRPVTIASRDGLQLSGYLTLPRGAQPKNLPTVLLVHGGPWMRTNWGDPFRSDDASYAQFLANRGYAVLEVDFRGSTGYGRSFLAAGIGEFGGKMQEDLLDAVHWAVETGTADPKRIAIMGWSYGGYAALVGLTTTPDVFACGISLGGPTDLASLIESFPPYWTVDLSMWHDYVGDPAIPDDRKEMTLKSPLSYADKVQRPVLIVQGENDVRVRPDQAQRMVEALRRAGKPVDYLRIPQMGHGMGYWVHRMTILRRTETFLHGCLGGRSSRFDPLEAVAWVWTRIKP